MSVVERGDEGTSAASQQWSPVRVLDYGSRRFRVGLDTKLRPHVVDATGARAGDLPDPEPGDDPALVAAARDRYAALRLELRTVGADEIRGLQRAMVDGRRWSCAGFRRSVVAHPLLAHVVPGLVWAVFDDRGAVRGTFRLVDGEPVDVAGLRVPVRESAWVGVAHPVHIAAAVPAWVAAFAQAGITQPFPQLAREIGRLAGDERDRRSLTRYAGRAVSSSRLSGLRWHGWRPGAPDADGGRHWIERDLPGDRCAVAVVEPPLRTGHPDGRDRVVTSVRVLGRHDDRLADDGGAVWGEVDPVLVSEILRDLDRVMP